MTIPFIQPYPLTTPVLLLTFNRLDTITQVFEAIRKAKPPRLYIASDGPRAKEGETEIVKDVRNFVSTSIDWDCEVKTLFREKNLGCKNAVSRAISWFFENEEMGIILEDDCLPTQGFFWFCEELLVRHKDDDMIGMICGRNDLGKYFPKGCKTHFFTSRSFAWGWASWRRVAENFDADFIEKNPEEVIEKLQKTSLSQKMLVYRMKNTKSILNKTVNSWAYPWGIRLHINNKLSIVPCLNLVKNIGWEAGATHTAHPRGKLYEVPQYEMNFPLDKNKVICPEFSDKTIARLTATQKIPRIIRYYASMVYNKVLRSKQVKDKR